VDVLKAPGTAGEGSDEREPLGKDATHALRCRAANSPNLQADSDPLVVAWQVRQLSHIAAVHGLGTAAGKADNRRLRSWSRLESKARRQHSSRYGRQRRQRPGTEPTARTYPLRGSTSGCFATADSCRWNYCHRRANLRVQLRQFA
jgi:hypothetical protein